MTDRELLKACLGAMLIAREVNARGTPTDWSHMIADIQKHLTDQP